MKHKDLLNDILDKFAKLTTSEKEYIFENLGQNIIEEIKRYSEFKVKDTSAYYANDNIEKRTTTKLNEELYDTRMLDLIKEIENLSVNKRIVIIERLIESFNKKDIKSQLETAADKLYDEYKNNRELTSFNNLDFEDFPNMEGLQFNGLARILTQKSNTTIKPPYTL